MNLFTKAFCIALGVTLGFIVACAVFVGVIVLIGGGK